MKRRTLGAVAMTGYRTPYRNSRASDKNALLATARMSRIWRVHTEQHMSGAGGCAFLSVSIGQSIRWRLCHFGVDRKVSWTVFVGSIFPRGVGSWIMWNQRNPSSRCTSAILGTGQSTSCRTGHFVRQQAFWGFYDYIHERSTEFSKEGKEWKYNLITVIHSKATSAGIALGDKIFASLNKIIDQGPYFIDFQMADAQTA